MGGLNSGPQFTALLLSRWKEAKISLDFPQQGNLTFYPPERGVLLLNSDAWILVML